MAEAATFRPLKLIAGAATPTRRKIPIALPVKMNVGVENANEKINVVGKIERETQMRMSNAFPSKYLRAADLEGRQVAVTIDRVAMEDVGDDDAKPVLYFIGKEKSMVLNKTNANNISFLYGDETEDWHGKVVTLYETQVDFQGRSVAAIRVKGPAKAQEMRREQITSGPVAAPVGHPINDDIPF